MLEEKPEYKKRKKYTKRRQQVIRQLFFTGVGSRCCYHRLCNMDIKV